MALMTNDYPLAGCAADGGCPFPIPTWAKGYLVRECVSFTAWRMFNDFGHPDFSIWFRGHNWGNASAWTAAAAASGFDTSIQHPILGDLAIMPGNYGYGVDPATGHIGVVVGASPTAIQLESYNWRPYVYTNNTIVPIIGPNGVRIQFARVNVSAPAPTPTPTPVPTPVPPTVPPVPVPPSQGNVTLGLTLLAGAGAAAFYLARQRGTALQRGSNFGSSTVKIEHKLNSAPSTRPKRPAAFGS